MHRIAEARDALMKAPERPACRHRRRSRRGRDATARVRASLAPMCTSPPGEDDAADDLALLHHGVAFGHARERQHGADERPDRAGGEQMQRDLARPCRSRCRSRRCGCAARSRGRDRSRRAWRRCCPSTTTTAFCATERRLSPNVSETTFSSTTSTPCLPVRRQTSPENFRSGLTMTSSAPAWLTISAFSSELVTAIDVRVHALHHLDLVQPEPAAGAGDQHRLPRLDLRDAERRAHAGADRTDRERRRLHVEAVRHADGVARGRAGEFGVAAATAFAQHAAVAAEVLPPAEAIAALPAIEPLVDHHALADALGRHVRAGLDDLARDLVARARGRARRPESCRRARARRDSRRRPRGCGPARRRGRAPAAR